MNDTTANTINFPVTVVLSQDQAARLASSKQNASEVATSLVGEYAKGGIMISSQDAGYMSGFCNTPLRSSKDIREIIENAVNRKSYDGTLVVSYRLDPAFAVPLEELCRMQGRSVDAIIQEAISIVLTNQWLYSIECSGQTLYFDRTTREELEHLVGGEVKGGAQLVDWIRDLKEKAATPPPLPESEFRLEKPKKLSIKEQVRQKLEEVHA